MNYITKVEISNEKLIELIKDRDMQLFVATKRAEILTEENQYLKKRLSELLALNE